MKKRCRKDCGNCSFAHKRVEYICPVFIDGLSEVLRSASTLTSTSAVASQYKVVDDRTVSDYLDSLTKL